MKKFLAVIGGLLLVVLIGLTILVFTTPSDFKVEREVTVNKPKAEVFAYIKNIKNQDNWAPWKRKDPAMKQEFKGTDGTVGFVSAWKSDHEEVGSGEQEITKIVEGERVDSILRFKEPFESQADAYMITEEVSPDSTKVKWGFSGNMPKPFNLMIYFVDMDKEVGKDFDEGLRSLKTILENPTK
ncbi:MAG: SRPBCC family protein [Pyrinomonadaceae bacterium]|nr:SRPBCC family protein [Pyrinomonadaceae bacterium]